jgi:hypothetical protein
MQVSSSPSRIGVMVSLVGVVLIITGFLLPMFTQSNPQVAGSIHPIYEWQTINVFLNTVMTPVLGFLAILPLLAMLIILATSVAALFQPPMPRLVLLKRIAAGWGLGLQLFFDVLIFQVFLIGYAHTDIAWGFVIVLIGFSVSVIGTFFIKSY